MSNLRRFPAEWELQTAVQLTLPHEGTDWADRLEEVMPCFVEIGTAISRFQPLLVVCKDATKAKDLFQSANVENIIFAEIDSNDTWARDHGPISIVENGKTLLLDFVFNGWGLKFAADKDNLISAALHKQGFWDVDMVHGGLVLEGGGIESDGRGTLMTTAECLCSPNRNPHLTQAEIESALKEKFGLERVLWLNHGYLAGDDTDSHIDTLARFCNEKTIAFVRCEDPEDEHFEAMSLMEQEIRAFRQSNGEPYQLVPLPWPDACFDEDGHRLPATYANFLIINGAVLVPTYGVPQDQAALDIFKTIYTDREIIGIDCSALILQHGSLHCVTMQYTGVSIKQPLP
jgi:agmatine deiminase